MTTTLLILLIKITQLAIELIRLARLFDGSRRER